MYIIENIHNKEFRIQVSCREKGKDTWLKSPVVPSLHKVLAWQPILKQRQCPWLYKETLTVFFASCYYSDPQCKVQDSRCCDCSRATTSRRWTNHSNSQAGGVFCLPHGKSYLVTLAWYQRSTALG